MKKTNPETIRRLGKDEEIPYDLLLLADETIEAINKYIFDSEIYVLEQNSKIIAEYALLPLNKEEVEIKNIAVAAEFQRQGIGKSCLKMPLLEQRQEDSKQSLLAQGMYQLCCVFTRTKVLRYLASRRAFLSITIQCRFMRRGSS